LAGWSVKCCATKAVKRYSKPWKAIDKPPSAAAPAMPKMQSR
jgi:hypothetical protein